MIEFFVLVFDLMNDMKEHNIRVLQIFKEFGIQALEATNEITFQKLMFLIRDWSLPEEHSYGLRGGQSLLKKMKSHPLLSQGVWQYIRSCFIQINCYLMPNPDSPLAVNDTEFIDNLKTFVPLILNPKNIVVKEIDERELTAKQLLEYFRVYTNLRTVASIRDMFKYIKFDNLFAFLMFLIIDCSVSEFKHIFSNTYLKTKILSFFPLVHSK